jgi:hypothetical protein
MHAGQQDGNCMHAERLRFEHKPLPLPSAMCSVATASLSAVVWWVPVVSTK